MSEIKYNRSAARMKMREILPSVPGDLLDHALFKALDAAQVDAALAAKDARIAELEQKVIGLEDYVAYIPDYRHLCKELRDKLAAQQQAEPTMAKNAKVAATHSEDGREVPDVVAWLNEEWGTVTASSVVVMDWDDSEDRVSSLMTVAQHERIVDAERGVHLSQLRDWRVKFMNLEAAKDAEIDALKGIRNQYWDDWNEAASNLVEMTRERDELRAQITDQPARQVGVEDWATVLEQYLDEECGRSGNAVPVGVPIYSISLPEIIEAVRRAALAPAAVVVPCRADERQSERYMNGWNSALDEVARLNRRAIPAGLLEKVADILESPSHYNPRTLDTYIDELRALLGKS